MRKTGIALILSLLVLNVTAQVRKAKIQFTKTVHDFGTIKEADGKVHYKFEFTNTGDVPLILTNVDASCGCTTPSWTKTPVLPGQKGFVDAEFDPAHYQKFNKSIKVYSNAEPQTVVLRIKGEVIPKEKSLDDIFAFELGSLKVKGKNIAFSSVSGKKTIAFEFYNPTNKDIKLKVDNLPNYISHQPDVLVLKAGKIGKMEFTATNTGATKGFHKDLINVFIDGKKYTNALKIIASIK